MITWVAGHLLAICIGLSLGLIGGGGSILAVPILVYVVGIGPKEAIAISLIVVGIVSLIGAVPHWLQKNINFGTALVFTPTAMLGAYLGARLASLPFISETFQLICFGIVMILASILMILKGSGKTANNSNLGKLKSEKHQWPAILIEGLGVGILTGFVGVGGGFAIIPALVLLGGIPMKEAVGTSLLIIAFKSATGFLGYLGQVDLDWPLIISFTTAAALGTIGGARLTQFIDAKHLQKGFGYFVLAIAIFVLVKS